MTYHNEIDVCQQAVSLATEMYNLTRGFPDTERYGMTSQIRRASTSIPANIAEGWGRDSTEEHLQHLSMARSSLLELETDLLVSRKLGYLSRARSEELQGPLREIARKLNQLITSLGDFCMKGEETTRGRGPSPQAPAAA